MELQCGVQTYEWGKVGPASEVARLAAVCARSLCVDPTTPYAELWMGTHPNAPSVCADSAEPLPAWLRRNLDSLGAASRREFGDDLPYLFKVLSVRKALSVQAHPNKAHAEQLHRERPDIYKDPNHKPELAIALTPFQALCGFRDAEEIRVFLRDMPELQRVLGEAISKDFLSCNKSDEALHLKKAFRQLMQCEASAIGKSLTEALARLEKENAETQTKYLYSLLKRLNEEFPGDRGCWVIYFLNYLNMNPGEAIFLGPDIPHAYLYGDCVECMACSDNVVRAGLTPKLIDVETLCEMLSYDSQSAQELLFTPVIEDEFTRRFRPPVKDFAVAQITIPHSKSEYNTILRPCASILLVVSGRATAKDSEERKIQRGSVLYLKASRQLAIKVDADCDEDLVMYQAMCNLE